MGILHEREFRAAAQELSGYDLSSSGKMVFPGNGSSAAADN